jgi:hypothetical protein
MRAPRPDEFVAEKLNTNGTSSPTKRGKTGAACRTLRPHKERTRTTSKINGISESKDRRQTMETQWPPVVPHHGNRRRQMPKRPQPARQKDPCVPNPETHLTEGDPRSLSSASAPQTTPKSANSRAGVSLGNTVAAHGTPAQGPQVPEAQYSSHPQSPKGPGEPGGRKDP